MSICGRIIRRAKNGADRGVCTNPVTRHSGRCGNGTCSFCGILLTSENSCLSTTGKCSICRNKDVRIRSGRPPLNRQVPGEEHTFRYCKCSGVLPARGKSNGFAMQVNGQFYECRVSRIMGASQRSAKKKGHKPIPLDTPHSVIRKLMKEPNCERCGESLSWEEVKAGKTPHLHHSHETGEIYGFTHPVCNPRALEIEIERLKITIKELKRDVA